ncbi:hypothetical protein K437DRAFT_296374 [Tilletiaria anomala UBC 951]|uniref:Uncharacterized protein n=1 Tax=Tilletiaria anomala (strain ATCC 24038 / CBS 436.72 / UBC 951) TaxID=1037660 RepID=A0A066VDI6_TILAU|nr:uncharacterized protein K437DRAFT_296374 [Tilletiaria anomala UBC 951]KDN38328.1 hypothetical protein K437DRAFT_296374 [Tilletiaria anomala UBC 951]
MPAPARDKSKGKARAVDPVTARTSPSPSASQPHSLYSAQEPSPSQRKKRGRKPGQSIKSRRVLRLNDDPFDSYASFAYGRAPANTAEGEAPPPSLRPIDNEDPFWFFTARQLRRQSGSSGRHELSQSTRDNTQVGGDQNEEGSEQAESSSSAGAQLQNGVAASTSVQSPASTSTTVPRWMASLTAEEIQSRYLYRALEPDILCLMPNSDLMKSIHAYAAQLYAAAGFLSETDSLRSQPHPLPSDRKAQKRKPKQKRQKMQTRKRRQKKAIVVEGNAAAGKTAESFDEWRVERNQVGGARDSDRNGVSDAEAVPGGSQPDTAKECEEQPEFNSSSSDVSDYGSIGSECDDDTDLVEGDPWSEYIRALEAATRAKRKLQRIDGRVHAYRSSRAQGRVSIRRGSLQAGDTDPGGVENENSDDDASEGGFLPEEDEENQLQELQALQAHRSRRAAGWQRSREELLRTMQHANQARGRPKAVVSHAHLSPPRSSQPIAEQMSEARVLMHPHEDYDDIEDLPLAATAASLHSSFGTGKTQSVNMNRTLDGSALVALAIFVEECIAADLPLQVHDQLTDDDTGHQRTGGGADMHEHHINPDLLSFFSSAVFQNQVFPGVEALPLVTAPDRVQGDIASASRRQQDVTQVRRQEKRRMITAASPERLFLGSVSGHNSAGRDEIDVLAEVADEDGNVSEDGRPSHQATSSAGEVSDGFV